MIPTPKLDHFSLKDYDRFYEPSEDTFLLLDTLQEERDFILNHLKPLVCVELGSGSGCVISFLAQMLGKSRMYFAIDINKDACQATLQTLRENNVESVVEVIQSDFFGGITLNCIDLLIFNPPYVPSEPEELGKRDITASYAGGLDGVEVLYQLLPKLKHHLSPGAIFYCILLQQNKPLQVIEKMKSLGFDHEVANKRRAGIELLYTIKFIYTMGSTI